MQNTGRVQRAAGMQPRRPAPAVIASGQTRKQTLCVNGIGTRFCYAVGLPPARNDILRGRCFPKRRHTVVCKRSFPGARHCAQSITHYALRFSHQALSTKGLGTCKNTSSAGKFALQCKRFTHQGIKPANMTFRQDAEGCASSNACGGVQRPRPTGNPYWLEAACLFCCYRRGTETPPCRLG